MKNLSTLFVILFVTAKIYSQDCNNYTVDTKDREKLEKFLQESPIHNPITAKLNNYKNGNSTYFPKGKYVPWAGYYMPFIYGGIANRWQECDTCHPQLNSLLTWEKVNKMSMDEIAKLSPAEKMDIYMGNAQFWFTENELKKRGPYKDSVQSWEGFCNGMRAAGALLSEPINEITVKSKSTNGTYYVKFFPADLKALAAAAYFYGEFGINIGENGKCYPNAGIFDLALRECLGNQKRTFFIDVSPNSEKWNESVVGYERQIVNDSIKEKIANSPIGTYKAVRVSVSLYLLGEIGISNSLTAPQIENKKYLDKWICEYILFTDKNNNILGGKWEKFNSTNPSRPYQKYTQPDYLWFVSGEGTDWLNWKKDGLAFFSFHDIVNLIYISTK